MARHLIPSDLSIRAVKPGDSRQRLNDGDGLYLLLFVKGGAHAWRFGYSLNGRRNNISLGTYPDTGLALARKKADEARRLVSEGKDPSEERKAGKAQAQLQQETARREAKGLPPPDAFEVVALEWLKRVHSHKVSAGHAERTRMRLEQDLFPWIGRLPIAIIRAPDVLACLRRVEARGALETAHRVRQAAGQVFRYGVATGRCERDPSADLRDALPPVQVKHHAAITDPAKTGALLRAIEDYRGHPVTRAALQMAALVFQRPGELRAAEWAEIDLAGALWTIPAARMKRNKAGKASGLPHLVPLSRQAVAVLQDLQPLTGGGRFVFPSPRTDSRPLSDNGILSALRRMGFGKDEMTGHGVRAMARTMLHERLNVPPEVIEAQLAHAVPDALGRAYNRTEFLEQRRQRRPEAGAYLRAIFQGG